MRLPERVRATVPADTADTWETIAAALPDELYLGGGTALAVHLRHRVSNDLDFFYHRDSVDLSKVRRTLDGLGSFAVVNSGSGTLNGVFSKTKVQFLHADEVAPQTRLEPLTEVGGISVAGIGDILAMKLKVVAERGELRDYFDLMAIEQQADRTVEEGMALFAERYGRPRENATIEPIIRALGYFDDIDEDLSLPLAKDEIAAYWRRRQPEIVSNVALFGRRG
jgi:predicted nucleotidyltransferase component of viral defense system